MRKEKVIIFGNTSFIGKNLYNFFKKNYKKKITVDGFGSKKVNLIKSKSINQLKNIINKQTTIFFLSVIAKQTGGTIQDFNNNIKMVENFSKVLNFKKPKKIVFFSTQSIYGEDTNNNSITEETKPNPTSFYGIAKYSSERLLSKISKDYKIPFLLLRMPRIYGPTDINYGPSKFMVNGLKNKTIEIWGDGQEKRDYVYIDDLIKVVIKLYKKKITGELNICSGHPVSFKKILEKIKKILNKKINVKYKKRTRPKVNHVMKNNHLKKFIGDFKFLSIKQGLESLLKAYNK